MKPPFMVLGLGDIQKKLRGLEPRVVKKAVRPALRAGIKLIAAEVKAKAPVGETKTLKAAIKIRARKRSRRVIAINLTIGRSDFKQTSYHAAAVEFGTKHQQGQHFAEAGFRAKDSDAMAIIKRKILDGILQAATAKTSK